MKRLAFRLGAIVIGLLAFIWILQCAVNPVTGKREFMLLSEADEIALGQQTDQQIIQQYGLYDNAELTNYIDQMGQKMGKITHRPNLKYSFKVLDTPVINAFAVPGGYVYFTRGILAYLNNEAELAGVMGHELGHVTARHTAVQYSRAQLAQVGLGVGMVLSEKFRNYAGLANLGVQLLFLRFSRDNERQADDLGVEYSTRVGYNANDMANFFVTLERMQPQDRDGLPAWFSTHPNPEDRVGTIKRKSVELQKKYPQEQYVENRDQYLQKINGIIYGDDPRQGYVEGNAFYHPELKLTFPIPTSWQVNNSPSQLQVVAPQQDAAILFSLAAGYSPSQAAQTFARNTQARIFSSDVATINGLPAQRMLSEVPNEQDTLRVLSYFIQKEDKIYVFHGLSGRSQFTGYQNAFGSTMNNFKTLTDPTKIKVTPIRLNIKSVKSAGDLRTVLKGLGVPDNKLEETALRNGKYLTDQIPANTLLKILDR